MKKFFLSIAVCVALVIGGTSCKSSSSTTGPNSKMECWEFTITYKDGSCNSGYIWNTADFMEAHKVYRRKVEGSVLEYKKSSKYKTLNDCVAAGCMIDFIFG